MLQVSHCASEVTLKKKNKKGWNTNKDKVNMTE